MQSTPVPSRIPQILLRVIVAFLALSASAQTTGAPTTIRTSDAGASSRRATSPADSQADTSQRFKVPKIEDDLPQTKQEALIYNPLAGLGIPSAGTESKFEDVVLRATSTLSAAARAMISYRSMDEARIRLSIGSSDSGRNSFQPSCWT
jgi:hypothetical protein